MRDLWGVDVAGYEWPSASLTTLTLLLADRHRGSEAAAQQLTADAARLSPDAPVRLVAVCDKVRLALQADVPGLGYAAVALEAAGRPSNAALPLICEPRAIENETLRVEVEADGSLTLLYKETGRQYRGLHRWVDEGDVGDTYDACPLPGPDTLAVLSGTPEVTVVKSGPLQAALRIEQRFEIPAAVTDNRRARSKLRVALPVTSLVPGCGPVRLISSLIPPSTTRRAITACACSSRPAFRAILSTRTVKCLSRPDR